MHSSKISSSASSKTLKTSKLCSTIQRPGAVSGSALVKIWALSRCSTHGWYTIDAPQSPQAMVYYDARDHVAPHTGTLLCSTMLHDGTPWWSTSTHRYTMIVFYNAPQCFTQPWSQWCTGAARTWSHKQSFLSPRRDAPVAHHRHMVLWSWKHFRTHQSVLVHWIMSRNYLQVLHVCTNQHNHGHTL